MMHYLLSFALLGAAANAASDWVQGPTIYNEENEAIAALFYTNDYVVDAATQTVNYNDMYNVKLMNDHVFEAGDQITRFFYAADVSSDGGQENGILERLTYNVDTGAVYSNSFSGVELPSPIGLTDPEDFKGVAFEGAAQELIWDPKNPPNEEYWTLSITEQEFGRRQAYPEPFD